jgi:hypothetical protein
MIHSCFGQKHALLTRPCTAGVLQRKLFTINQQDLGDGSVTFAWSPRGSWLAVAGSKVCVWGVGGGGCTACRASSMAPVCSRASALNTPGCCAHVWVLLALQRLVSVFDQHGQLVGEVHLAPAEVPAADARQCSCLQLQVLRLCALQCGGCARGCATITQRSTRVCRTPAAVSPSAVGRQRQRAGGAACGLHFPVHVVCHDQGAADAGDRLSGEG